MPEPISAIPKGGDAADLVELTTGTVAGGELPRTNPESSDALDILLKAAETDLPVEDDEPVVMPKVDAPPVVTPPKVDAPPVVTPPKVDAPPVVAPPKVDAPPVVVPDKPKDAYDAIELPPNTSKRAGDSFAQVKTLARQQEAESLKTITALNEKVTALEEKVKTGLPAETKKELDELRSFRAKLDVEADPAFKEWDGKVSENVTAIYAKLKSAAIGDDVIAKIKELGGPSEVNWEALGDKLPAQVRRYIEGKLFENEDLTEKKAKALEKAKSNAADYLKTRQAEVSQSGEARKQIVEAQLKELTPQMPWLQEQTPTDKSTPEEKKSIEAHNKLLKEIQTSVSDAVNDDSPEMRAILILGFAQLQKARADFESHKLTSAAEKAALELELKEAKDMVERIKKSATGRLRESSAPARDGVLPKTDRVNPNEDAGSALDRHLAAERAKQQQD